MSNLRKAAEQAREALKMMLDEYGETNCLASDHADAAIYTLCDALAEPVQEPEGYFSINDYGRWEENESEYGTPLYTAPPQRKPLTEEEIDVLSRTMVKGDKSVNWLCRAIEAAHGIGDNT